MRRGMLLGGRALQVMGDEVRSGIQTYRLRVGHASISTEATAFAAFAARVLPQLK